MVTVIGLTASLLTGCERTSTYDNALELLDAAQKIGICKGQAFSPHRIDGVSVDDLDPGGESMGAMTYKVAKEDTAYSLNKSSDRPQWTSFNCYNDAWNIHETPNGGNPWINFASVISPITDELKQAHEDMSSSVCKSDLSESDPSELAQESFEGAKAVIVGNNWHVEYFFPSIEGDDEKSVDINDKAVDELAETLGGKRIC